MGEFVRLSSRSVILSEYPKNFKFFFIFQINMRVQVASLLLLSAMVMVQADKSSYPTTYDTTYYSQNNIADKSSYPTTYDTNNYYSQNNIAPYPEYDDTSSSLTDQFGDFFGVSEKQSGFDLDTVLAIAVFGGLGLGALAWVDSINHRTKLCNKLKEVTKVARGTASAGTTTVALASSISTVTGYANVNTVVNSNREFINSLANVADLAC